jgi:hypothetical protein
MPFYQKGDVRIRYEEAGSGFPLLVTPGGGLNSRVSNWPTAVFNPPEALKNDFRVITMDQRNANGGESNGPIPTGDPWDAFADDQLGLMDHLGIREFFYMGLRREAPPACARARRRRCVLSDGRAPAGTPGLYVQLRQGCLGARAATAPAGSEHGAGRAILAQFVPRKPGFSLQRVARVH